MTIRPRPAVRIAGNKALVNCTGPSTWVANIRSHSSIGVSSTVPAAEMPALCTSTRGAPTASSITLAAAATDAASVRSNWTGISRESSTTPATLARNWAMPDSGARIAASTRQPCRYICATDARPSPREAPVITMALGSPMRRPAASTVARCHHLGAPVWLGTHPGGPDANRIRSRLTVTFVKSLRVIDFGFG